jgi:hypothetical protein
MSPLARGLILFLFFATACSRALGVPEGEPGKGEPERGVTSQGPCAALSTADACEAAPGCHGLYVGCASCICRVTDPCLVFDRCVDGPARCEKARTNCDVPDPRCAAPFAVAYDAEGFCAEGCARADRCE